MDEQELAVLLEQMAEDFQKMVHVPIGEVTPETKRFMEGVYGVTLAILNTPSLKASANLQQFFNKCSDILHHADFRVMSFTEDLYRRVGIGYPEFSDTKDWEDVCQRRSSIEFYLDLFGGYFGEEYITHFKEHVDIEELDLFMRRRLEFDASMNASLIPPGMPRSHWWWYEAL